jgi:CRISPR-associated protein Cmr3
MRATSWLLPSVVAGSFRTALTKANGRGFDPTTQNELVEISVAGGFPHNGELLLPAPLDCVIQPQDDNNTPSRTHNVRPCPMNADEGCDLPMTGLDPVMLGDEVTSDFKPDAVPVWWPLSQYANWLTTSSVDFKAEGFLQAAEQDLRDHVGIEANRGAADDSKLYTTIGLAVRALPRVRSSDTGYGRFSETTLQVRVDNLPDWAKQLEHWHPLGGERRLAHWQLSANDPWPCPQMVSQTLQKAKRVRMILTTPAIFQHGWRPGWLDDSLLGTPPGATGVQLKLKGVSISRWRAVSGWNYHTGQAKAIRRMVPAGAVYFFEVVSGEAATLNTLWLRSVCDNVREQREGFGLATWGIW